MPYRLGCCALAVLVAVSYATCQNPITAGSAGTYPLSEPGDPPGLAELLRHHPRIVERPLITGRQAMVTSLEPLASMAGMRVLQQGGNAFDAAVATAIALTVVDPRMSSVGGNGFATIYVAKTHEVKTLNFYGSAPQHATIDFYKGKDYSHGFLSVPVPSCLKGSEALHKAYGRLPWARVLEPAMELAEGGFVLTQPLGDFIPIYQDEFSKFPSTAKVFLPNGRALKTADIFRQPDLARTLKGIAEHGSDSLLSKLGFERRG
jgi:gamma-glutamyltranspeptidase / glutathione hydrolase